MRSSLRALLVAVCAACAVAAASAPAAQAYSIAPTGAITATSNGPIWLNSTLSTFLCEWNLQGQITASSASIGDTIGTITSGTLTNCLGGIRAEALFPAPWSIRLTGVLGSSPLTGATIVISDMTFGTSPATPCLYRGAAAMLVGQASGGSSAVSILTNSIRSPCSTGSLRGSFTLSPGITMS